MSSRKAGDQTRISKKSASSSTTSSSSANSTKYSIQWPADLKKLPPIESFQLNTILDNDLKVESTEVVNALLDVTANYKKDLKLEIRHNLSTEQKIQHKNIKIAKDAHQLNKKISRRNRHFDKFLNSNDLDAELTELMESTVACNDLISSLGPRLKRIESIIGHTGSIGNYKTLNKIWGNAEQKKTSPTQQKLPNGNDNGMVHKGENGRSNGNGNGKVNGHRESSPAHSRGKVDENRSHTSGKKRVNPDASEPESSLENDTKSNGKASIEFTTPVKPTPRKTSFLGSPSNDEDMDEATFEQFMSTSITKYRELQSKKERQHFEFPDIILPEGFDGSPNNSRGVSSASLMPFNTPISSMKLSAKSPATTSQTLQSSHFKKLRINGSPITSSTYLKMKSIPACDCSVDNVIVNSEHELEVGNSSTLGHDHSHNQDRETMSDQEASLKQSLSKLSTLILNSDEEAQTNSSGLTTDDSDNILSSNSSDDDSEEDQGKTPTDMYYISLHSNLKKKKRKLKTSKKSNNGIETPTNGNHIKIAKQSPIRNDNTFKADGSPTPKHKPSHYTLKPKKSILKFPKEIQQNKAEHIIQEQLIDKLEMNLTYSRTREATAPRSGPVPLGLNKVSTSSPFSFLRNPSIIKPQPSIDSTSAIGTMVSIDNEDDEEYYEDTDVTAWNGEGVRAVEIEDRAESVLSDNASDTRSIRSIARLRGLL